MILRLCFRHANRRSGVGEPPKSRVSAVVHKTKLCLICLTEKSRHDFSVQTWKSKVSCVCRSCCQCQQAAGDFRHSGLSLPLASLQLECGFASVHLGPKVIQMEGGGSLMRRAQTSAAKATSVTTMRAATQRVKTSQRRLRTGPFTSTTWRQLEMAETFSSGKINDAELLSQRFGLEEILEALQRADYSLCDYARERYTANQVGFVGMRM